MPFYNHRCAGSSEGTFWLRLFCSFRYVAIKSKVLVVLQSNTVFYNDFVGCEADPNIGALFIRDLYERSNDQLKKYSVPVLWDKKTNTIVNNESSEIVRMFTQVTN